MTILALNSQGVRLISGGAFFSVQMSSVINPAGLQPTVTVVDNNDGTYTASFTVTVSGTFSLSVTLGGQAIQGSPKSITVGPGPTLASTTVVSAAGGSVATAGVAASMQIQARDEYGNRRSEGGDTFGLDVVEALTGARIHASVHDLGDGSYNVLYTSTISGAFRVDLMHSNTLMAVPGINIVVAPARAHGPASVAEGLGLRRAVAGKASTASVWLRDQYGNAVAPDDLLVTATLVLAPTPLTVPVETRKGSKNVQILFLATQSGQYMLEVMANQAHVSSSPFHVRVSNGAIDPTHCTAHGFGTMQALAGSTGTFEISSRDAYMNNVSTGEAVFAVSMMHIATFQRSFYDVFKEDGGIYSVQYNITLSLIHI